MILSSKENVARLQALENSDISQTEEQLQALKQTTGYFFRF